MPTCHIQLQALLEPRLAQPHVTHVAAVRAALVPWLDSRQAGKAGEAVGAVRRLPVPRFPRFPEDLLGGAGTVPLPDHGDALGVIAGDLASQVRVGVEGHREGDRAEGDLGRL